MFKAPTSPYLVPDDGSFRITNFTTTPPDGDIKKKIQKEKLRECNKRLDELQQKLYAHDQYSLLLVFQGMDAAGKDSTIRAVLRGINPAGCQVCSFKQPSNTELDHDYLWRSARQLPERGRIGVFNRSYYEEVLVVKVHPEYLENQKLPQKSDDIWKHRYASIRDHEKHLARNGTVVLKFWLNVSREEQRERFLSRLNEPEKHWKFSRSDVKERGFWDQYMAAFETALAETSRPWAPWYAIPADNKPFMRACVADIVVKSMESLDMQYPEVHESDRAHFEEMRQILSNKK